MRIRGTEYPLVLPTLRDPRLHLAGVIITLQVLGQVAFDFRVSIAQILISILTCAVLEVAITFRQQRVIMWPASAMLTGNGVAFILRVPGTEHGDWWSMHGWWIYAGTAAVSLLSKYLIRFRGRHVFNPSNFGLVLCFLLLGSTRAEPLDFWWGPMTIWLALALALIVAGGFAILRRLHLLGVAISFWLVFAAGIAVLAATEHAMTARWHLGPITESELWRILVFSPEILVFLFFMITDPKTSPEGKLARRVFGASIGLLAVLLIAPQTTEFATKVAVLAALSLVCAARPLLELALAAGRTGPMVHRAQARLRTAGRVVVAGLTAVAVVAAIGTVLVAGLVARPTTGNAGTLDAAAGQLPEVRVIPSDGVATQLDRNAAEQIVLATLTRMGVPAGEVDRAEVTLEPGAGQGPPIAVATMVGTQPLRFERTFELAFDGAVFAVTGERGSPTEPSTATQPPTQLRPEGFVAPDLRDVAGDVGLRFRHGAFRFTTSPADPVAMMGGGLCWLDADADGWMDLFVVNSHSVLDVARWKELGDLPRSALFHNDGGTFTDVSSGSGANLAIRGNGCVAADFDLDGHTDLYVTSSTYDALLWNEGDGTFTEGARAAGIDVYGWHAGAAVGDVNGDRLPDLYVTGYTDMNAAIPDRSRASPRTTGGSAISSTSTRAPRDRAARRSARWGSSRASTPPRNRGTALALCSAISTATVASTSTWPTTRTRTSSTGTRPGRAGPTPTRRGSASACAMSRRAPASRTATPAWGSRRATTTGTAWPTSSSRTRAARDTPRTVRSRPAPPRPHSPTRGRGSRPRRSRGGGRRGSTSTSTPTSICSSPTATSPSRASPRMPNRSRCWSRSRRRGARSASRTSASSGGGTDRMRTNGRGLAAADYDNDGDVDVAINSIAGPLILLENQMAGGAWLEVSLPTGSPGTRVVAVLPDGRRLVRVVLAGGSYLSSEDPRALFGLGDARRVSRLLIRYPDGTRARLDDVGVNRSVAAPRGERAP